MIEFLFETRQRREERRSFSTVPKVCGYKKANSDTPSVGRGNLCEYVDALA